MNEYKFFTLHLVRSNIIGISYSIYMPAHMGIQALTHGYTQMYITSILYCTSLHLSPLTDRNYGPGGFKLDLNQH